MKRQYLVSGEVQGVGFRYFTRRAGQRTGVSGWVRNLPDGRVEALADGTQLQLEEFERALRQGPPGSSVTGLHMTDIFSDMQALITFDIR